MRISDWSSDVCSSDLFPIRLRHDCAYSRVTPDGSIGNNCQLRYHPTISGDATCPLETLISPPSRTLLSRRSSAPASTRTRARRCATPYAARSEEHTSELQSLMRISSAVFCLTKKH